VLTRARWRLADHELAVLHTVADVRGLRNRRRLPRLVALAEGDHELLVDLDRDASVEIGLRALAGRKAATLVEVYPLPGELPAHGPAGDFTHEFVVPFTVGWPATSVRASARVTTRVATVTEGQRRFPPGSSWCSFKAYAGTAGTDDLLREVIAPAVARTRLSRAASNWFFVRYADPGWHLRLRFTGDPERLRAQVEPALAEALANSIADGRVWRVQLDTYEREIERYGGLHGMELAEQVFCADSDAALQILALAAGEHGLDARWRLCLASVDLLLDDLGFDLEAKQRFAQRQRDGYRTEWATDPSLERRLGQRFRAERAALEGLLWDAGPGHWLAPGLTLLHNRSARLRPIVEQLHELDRAGRLTVPIEAWAASVTHMAANRLLRSAQRAQELVLWDWLARLHRARLAQTGQRQ
jgi:thiopeptide-type bacteriocin biosynthesis protein